MTLDLTPQEAQLVVELMNLGQKTLGLTMHPSAYAAAAEIVQKLTKQATEPQEQSE